MIQVKELFEKKKKEINGGRSITFKIVILRKIYMEIG